MHANEHKQGADYIVFVGLARGWEEGGGGEEGGRGVKGGGRRQHFARLVDSAR